VSTTYRGRHAKSIAQERLSVSLEGLSVPSFFKPSDQIPSLLIRAYFTLLEIEESMRLTTPAVIERALIGIG
jgi:hypothetical protein